FYLIIWIVSSALNKNSSTSSKRESFSDFFNNKKQSKSRGYSSYGSKNTYTDYGFNLKIKPQIICTIHILNSSEIASYLKRNILNEMYGKNVQYRSEILAFINTNYMKSYGFINSYTQLLKRNYNIVSRIRFIRNQVRMLHNIKKATRDSLKTTYLIARLLGVSDWDFSSILKEFNINYSFSSQNQENYYRSTYTPPPRSGKDPFTVLGLTHNATLKQIKNAYIKLVSRYHPDRYVSKSPSAKKAAEEKMKDINVAYEEAKKRVKEPSYQKTWN
ncbi:DnaJ domain-containing protein, partial [Candidatus Dependentiae bacterium]|nr:DnaJ domain-containing protein [Candidatus Dependentiae bacterium]